MARCGGKSCFEIKDTTPDKSERWIQKPGGGTYKEKIVNGYRGEIFNIKARDIKEILSY